MNSGVAAWQAGAAADDDEYIYALFRTRRDPAYSSQAWDGDKIMSLIEAFETDVRNKPVENLGRTSPPDQNRHRVLASPILQS